MDIEGYTIEIKHVEFVFLSRVRGQSNPHKYIGIKAGKCGALRGIIRALVWLEQEECAANRFSHAEIKTIQLFYSAHIS